MIETTGNPTGDRMLRWFEYEHLPPHLQRVSKEFCQLADTIVALIPSGPERTVALRKLLESKDAAVRAAIEGQGSK
jgi:hypothetical protein